MKTHRSRLWDFGVAALLLVAANFVKCPSVDNARWENVRLLNHRLMDSYIRKLKPDIRFDWIFFGDSRALRLNGGNLCERLPGSGNECLNASTTSGDWFTSHLIYRDLKPHMTEATRIVIFVSGCWFEGRDTGLIPESIEYAAMGSPSKAAASYVPMSALRATRMEWVHQKLDSWALGWRLALGGPELAAAHEEEVAAQQLQTLFRSNVETWFLPLSSTQRRERLRFGRVTLEEMIADGHPPVLVNLPNLGIRDDFVDERFPGRRQRFLESISALARDLELPFINLDGRLKAIRFFKDFHHLNDKGRDRLIPILARKISQEWPDADR